MTTNRHAWVMASLASLLSLAVHAADSLEPAVNTSAPDHLAAPATAPPPAATSMPARTAAPAATIAPAPVIGSPASTTVPATRASAKGDAASSNVGARTGGAARDRVELENTQITGNRELPKVMYVVPWKRPDLGDFGGRPSRSLLDDLLTPVDRDVFKRQNRYFEALQPDGTPAPSDSEK